MAFVNDVQPLSGIGKYARELARRVDQDFFQISYPSKDEQWIADLDFDRKIRMRSFPVYERTLNNKLGVLDRKIPERDFYHFSNQDVVSKKDNAIWTVHDIFQVVWRDRNPSIYSHLKGSTIIVNSEYTKKQLEKLPFYNSLDIHVVYLGVDKEVFYPREVETRESKIRLLNVGTEVERKNILELYRVVDKLIKRTEKEVELIRIGSKSSKSQELIQNLGIEENVVYKSGLTEKELALEYNKADYFISTSKDEGFCLPVLEAIACGTKPVLSDIPVFQELYSDYAILTENYVEPILKGEKEVKVDKLEYSWEKTSKQSQRVYQEFLE